MIFTPINVCEQEGAFLFSGNIDAEANACIDKEVLREVWLGSTYRTSMLRIAETDQLIFRIGDVPSIAAEEYMYTIRVTEQGVCVAANSKEGLIKGYMTLLDRIKPMQTSGEEMVLSVDCCEIMDKPFIHNQMAHFCVFPETELWELQKYIRLCGALKYSHIVLEFWGMLQYDCMKELSWSQAYKKEEIRPLIKEANDMGMEIIPMFNHWGHASGSRLKYGKHVVLDQNPKLQYLFAEDGWSWNICNEKAKTVLKKVREELIELCGEGKYFHLGCDEVFGFTHNETSILGMAKFLKDITEELEAIGRRPIIWGDMFITPSQDIRLEDGYVANCLDEHIQRIWMENLDRRIVIADWQYDVKQAPVKSALMFQEKGFDVLLCPWYKGDSCSETVKEYGLLGIMHTTWHTLYDGKMKYLIMSALNAWQNEEKDNDDVNREPLLLCKSAALLRKLFFVDGDYKKAGWHIKELPQK